ncbi:MAG: HEAT repeat domain-containing protein [Bacillota bacterium]
MKKDIQELIKALKSKDETKRDMAVIELMDTGVQAAGELLKAVNDANPGVRGPALEILAFLAGERVIPVLVEKLADINQKVRHVVDKALRKYKYSEALIDAYLEQLKSFNDELVIEILVRLEEYKTAKVAKATIPILNHRNYFVKTRAFITLCRIPNIAVTQDLLDYFEREKDEEFRVRCLETLHYIADYKAVPVLGKYLGKESKVLNRGLIWTIGSIGGMEALKVLTAYALENRHKGNINYKLLSEAIGLVLNSLGMWGLPLEYLSQKNEVIRELINELRPGYVFDTKYYVFNSNYFHEQVAKRGFDYRQYEKLFRSPGKKRDR